MDTEIRKYVESLKRDSAFMKDVKGFIEANKPAVAKLTEMYLDKQRYTEAGAAYLGVGAQQGNVDTETPELAATLEIFSWVIRGYDRFMDDSFVRKVPTDKATIAIPHTEYQELVGPLVNGVPPATDKVITYLDIALNKEFGGNCTWSRSGLEDSTFDLAAEEAEGLGKAMAIYVMGLIVAELEAVVAANSAKGSDITIGAENADGTLSWKEFKAVIAAVSIGQSGKMYGPATHVLVSPSRFFELLDILQLTNTLYEGSTDPINSGVISTKLGVKIVMLSQLGDDEIYAVNMEKAIVLAIRRAIKIEPVLFPLYNLYGLLATMRATVKVNFAKAIQRGKTSA